MATGSKILAWEILWTKEPGKRNSWDCKSWTQLSDYTTTLTNLGRVLKSRDITLPTKVHTAMVFPVVLYRCENWILKKAEYQRIDDFEWWLSGAGVTRNGEFLFNVGRACFSR